MTNQSYSFGNVNLVTININSESHIEKFIKYCLILNNLKSSNNTFIELVEVPNDPNYAIENEKKSQIIKNNIKFSLKQYTPQKLGPNLIFISKNQPKSFITEKDQPQLFNLDTGKLFFILFKEEQKLENFISLCKVQRDSSHLQLMDPATVQPYFHYYGKLSNQMNMLQDNVRTSSYHLAIIGNPSDFYGKTVLDVGAGSGILSYFAVQAGAKQVYSVEPSSVSSTIKLICSSNQLLKNHVNVIVKTIEEIEPFELGYQVDVLVSEPLGTFLFNERMIESYLYARDHFLKPGGKMFPNKCTLALAPFSDNILYYELISRAKFWEQNNFYGVNLSSAFNSAVSEQFTQPIVDYIDPSLIITSPHFEIFNFEEIDRNSLSNISFDFEYLIENPTLVHGLAGWFDVCFDGTDQKVGFSTSPWSAPTHWYQIRFLFNTPLAVNKNQKLIGNLTMNANNKQSYYINIYCEIAGTSFFSQCQNIDLKDPDYRYCTSTNTYMPQHTYVYQSTPVQSSNSNNNDNIKKIISNNFEKNTDNINSKENF